jgi:hypothetical protein
MGMSEKIWRGRVRLLKHDHHLLDPSASAGSIASRHDVPTPSVFGNTAWIPAHTSRDWQFSTSDSGRISDSHACEQLSTVFEPETRPENLDARRLLIMDGHGSHTTANVTAHCMERTIDLLIFPPHCSHILQPLDVSVFSPLERALAVQTDTIA